QSPRSGGVSLRTFNRNFKGRSGTNDADIYLVSPETAAISAIEGVLTTGMGTPLAEIEPVNFTPNDNFVVYPEGTNTENTPVEMGPNIQPFPLNVKLEGDLEAEAVLITGDNITTDDIMPSDSRILPYRSNVPKLSEYSFEKIDSEFPARCKAAGTGVIVGGENYGQGSSREHAALVPLYLGIRFVMAKSFARIHRSNLINSGIIPMVFKDPADHDRISLGDRLVIENAPEQVKNETVTVKNITRNESYEMIPNLSDLELTMILDGGKINMLKEEA
ncbi:MAG: aconitate hydratase, partial [Clostridia bacterium]|nr:aconitate hydratase [Clostridia bacterium]